MASPNENPETLAPAVDTAAEATASTPPAAAPARAVFIDPQTRETTVPLKFPVEYQGRVYHGIRLRRLSARDIADFFTIPEAERPTFPWFDAPQAVLDALDLDDADEVSKAAEGFIPARFRAVVGGGLTQQDGEASSQG